MRGKNVVSKISVGFEGFIRHLTYEGLAVGAVDTQVRKELDPNGSRKQQFEPVSISVVPNLSTRHAHVIDDSCPKLCEREGRGYIFLISPQGPQLPDSWQSSGQ